VKKYVVPCKGISGKTIPWALKTLNFSKMFTFFVICFTTLSAPPIITRRMVNEELERILKEAVLA